LGTSHFKSNILGKTGDETIRGFTTISATTLTGATVKGTTAVNAESLTATTVDISGVTSIAAGQHIKIGAHQYILFGDETDNDAIEAVATAVDASCKGSMYISTDGTLWIMTDDTTVASVTVS